MDAVHLMRAATGRDLDHQGRGLLPRPPRLRAGVDLPEADEIGPADAAVRRARGTPASRRRSATSSWSSPFNDLAAVERVLARPAARSPA